jgi:hypothetical protein
VIDFRCDTCGTNLDPNARVCPRCKILVTARPYGWNLSLDSERRLKEALAESLAQQPAFRWAVVKRIAVWIVGAAITITGVSIFSIFEIRQSAKKVIAEEKNAIRKEIVTQFEEEKFRTIVHDVALDRAGQILTNAIRPAIDSFESDVQKNIGSVEAETRKIQNLTTDLKERNNFETTLLSALCDDFRGLCDLRSITTNRFHKFFPEAIAAYSSVERFIISPELASNLNPGADPRKIGMWKHLQWYSLARPVDGDVPLIKAVSESDQFSIVERLFFYRYMATSAKSAKARYLAVYNLSKMQAEAERRKFEGFQFWKSKAATDWARGHIKELSERVKEIPETIVNPALAVPKNLVPLLTSEPIVDDLEL